MRGASGCSIVGGPRARHRVDVAGVLADFDRSRTAIVKRGLSQTRSLFAGALLMLAFGVTFDHAVAQESDEREEELIVTAHRRDEPLSKFPASISVIGGDEIGDGGASGLSSLRGRVPGLQLFGYDPTATQLSLRGIVTDRSARTPSTTALFLDDASIAFGQANPNLELLDLERIEVLRGPQGTFFGASAEAGALRFITKKPNLTEQSFELALEGNVVDSDPGGAFHGVANLPLADGRAALRIVGYGREQGAYIDNVTLGLNDTNGATLRGYRVSARLQPHSDWIVDLTLADQDFRSDDMSWSDGARGAFDLASSVLQPTDADTTIGTLTISNETSFGTMTALVSRTDTSAFRLLDATRYAVQLGAAPGAFPDARLPTYFAQSGSSFELRFASLEGPLSWVGGIYHARTTNEFLQTLPVPGFEAAVPAAPPASSFGLAADNLYRGIWDFETIQSAVFFDGKLRLSERLSSSVGARWYDYGQEGGIDYTGLLQGRHDVLDAEASAQGVSPRFNLTYQLASNALVYVQAARGFRIGGLNEPLPAAICDADIAASGLSAAPLTFEPDRLWNHEVGMRAASRNGGASIGVAAFSIDWSDIQITKRLGCGYVVILNGGEITSRGVEIEGAIEITPNLRLSGNATYTNSEIVETSPAGGLGTSVGQQAPFQPELAFLFSHQQRHRADDLPAADPCTRRGHLFDDGQPHRLGAGLHLRRRGYRFRLQERSARG